MMRYDDVVDLEHDVNDDGTEFQHCMYWSAN